MDYNIKYQNYLDHEDHVHAIDGILSHSQDWKWFIEIVERDFDLADVDFWLSFKTKGYALLSVYSLLVKIRSIYGGDLISKSVLLNDLIAVADFFVGTISRMNCEEKLSTQFGRVFLLCAWLTKLENIDNGTANIYSLGMLIRKNYFSLIGTKTFDEQQEEIENYISSIKLKGWETPSKCIQDNLNRVEYPYVCDFFEQYSSQLYQVNAFSWQDFPEEEDGTWEERFLLEMVGVEIEEHSFHPMIGTSTGDYPDSSEWTETRIDHMQTFFSHPIADFILETVRYVLYSITPSAAVILTHCKFLNEYLVKHSLAECSRCSSFTILSMLFKEKRMKIVTSSEECKKLLENFHHCAEPETIQILQSAGFPLTKEQKDAIEQYAKELYQTISNISTPWDFETYVSKPEIAHFITNEYVLIVAQKFQEILPIDGRMSPNLFWAFMCFLFEAKNNTITSKPLLQKIMIRTQQLWENEYYEQSLSRMKSFGQGISLSQREIEQYNSEVLENPIIVARAVMSVDEESLSELMYQISENAFSLFVAKTIITRTFPYPETIAFDRHDVDVMVKEYIEKILKAKGYKFLNQLDPEQYMQGVLERIKLNAYVAGGLLHADELYEQVVEIGNKAQMTMLAYNDPVMPAHVTQLFPLLEIKIRELAQIFGVFPFKEKKDSFMQAKDPSSILREIIEMIYRETESFELVPDILFVYYMMYNSNSLNIRNECVHGRNYISENDLPFALIITCLSIMMIEKKIRGIRAYE